MYAHRNLCAQLGGRPKISVANQLMTVTTIARIVQRKSQT